MSASGADLDWEHAPIFGEGEAPNTERLSAELATLPSAPARAPDELIPWRDAGEILGLSRGGVVQMLKTGQLTERGKVGRQNLVSRAEVEALAAERASRKLEKGLPAPLREQRQLERSQNVNTDPRIMARDQTARLHMSEDKRRHEELAQGQRAIVAAIEISAQQQLSAARGIERALLDIGEQLSALNTGLLVAGVGAGAASLLTDQKRLEIKQLVAGLFRKQSEPTISLVAGADTEPEHASPEKISAAKTDTIIAELSRLVEPAKT